MTIKISVSTYKLSLIYITVCVKLSFKSKKFVNSKQANEIQFSRATKGLTLLDIITNKTIRWKI